MTTSKISQSARRLYIGGSVLLVTALILLVGMFLIKRNAVQTEAQARTTEVAAGPRVRTASVTKSSAERTLSLLGEVRPYATVTLYGTVGGYLKKILVDKGDKVSEGKVLAVIESPQTDQAYNAAVADAKNKIAIAARNQDLLQQKLVSQQVADQSDADAATAKATLASYTKQREYETIKAPFSGTVTARYVDVGALVQNASNSTSALPVVTISQTSRLRIYIYFDQRDAMFVHAGDPVEISVAERPDLKIAATLTRFTGELDAKTRTLLAEIDLDNSKGELLSGSFVQVAVKIKSQQYMEVPSEALVIRGDKSFVPIVKDGIVTYREIKIADNNGQKVKVRSGLEGNEEVALNLGDTVADGGHVQVIAKPAGK
jgi:RND family efflux transporter MFP subunit